MDDFWQTADNSIEDWKSVEGVGNSSLIFGATVILADFVHLSTDKEMTSPQLQW